MACYILRNASTSTYMTIVFDNKPGTFVAFTRRRDAYAFAHVCEPKAQVEKMPRQLLQRYCNQANARYCVLNPKGKIMNCYFEEPIPDPKEQMACLESLWNAS